MAFDNFDFGSPSQGNSNNTTEKKIYYGDEVRTFTVGKNASAEVRILDSEHVKIREGYFKGPERVSKRGNRYEPGSYIPFVGDLPGFNGRCVLANIAPNLGAVDKYVFKAFDFRWFHKKETVNERSIVINHEPCSARGSMPNGNVCQLCDVDVPRVLGGRKIIKLTKNQAVAMFQHDTHIMQFPISDNPMEFFGRKVQCLSASCSECGEEVFSERKLQLLSPDQVVANVTRNRHECPNCGHVGKLVEKLVAENGSGEVKDVERGDIHCKNVEIKREPAQRGTRLVFHSDLLPFESVLDSLKRLKIPEEAAKEAYDREFNFAAAAAPYGLDPEKFDDPEKYVKAVTNAQLRQVNWIIHGTNRDKYFSNPFFEYKPSGGPSSESQSFGGDSHQSSGGFASRFRK